MCLKNPLENKRHRKARCVERMLKAEITSVLTKSEEEKVIASSPCSNSLLQSVPAAALPPPTPLGSLSPESTDAGLHCWRFLGVYSA